MVRGRTGVSLRGWSGSVPDAGSSDTTRVAGGAELLCSWPRGAGSVSTVRLLGAASRHGTSLDRTALSPDRRIATSPVMGLVSVMMGRRRRRLLHGARPSHHVGARLALELQSAVRDGEGATNGSFDLFADLLGLLE